MSSWLWIQLACSFYMTGVIWIVQCLLYPTFQKIGVTEFQKFHLKHTHLMGLLVGPIMVVEFVSAAAMALSFDIFSVINLALVLILWLVTFAVSVPMHRQLVVEQDQDVIQKLVRTNWWRTALWTLKSLGVLGYSIYLLQGR